MPANEEPASTKPKARMKLSARMVLSPNSVAGGAAVVVVKLITMGGFARDAPKAENGFVVRENCFVALGRDETFGGKAQSFQMGRARAQSGLASSRSGLEAGCARQRVMLSAFHTSHAFYVFLLKRAPTKAGPVEPGRVGCDPSHRNREARISTGRVHVREGGHHDGGEIAQRRATRTNGRTAEINDPFAAAPPRRRNGAAVEPRLRGRAAGIRAADRLASRQSRASAARLVTE